MTQYLLEIKGKCDVIVVFGSLFTPKNIIIYTLNRLPPTYQAFKTSIHINLQSITLDNFYVLLESEEVNIANDVTKEAPTNVSINQQFALMSRRKGRNRSNVTEGPLDLRLQLLNLI